ncbi:MAG: substrate-binding domain-containing protein [Thermodesulfobacteriota bacterium]
MQTRTARMICRLKQFRQSKGLSQGQIAELVGVKRQAIYDIESGRYLPNTAVALRLARQLGCRVEDLFSEEGDEAAQPVLMAEGQGSSSPRISLAKVRGHLFGYPLDAEHVFGHELRAADGILEGSGDRVRLFTTPEYLDKTILLLGCDPAFSLLAAHVSRASPAARVSCRFASSHRALERLSAGRAHIAGTHLHNSSGEDSNVLAARTKLSGIGGLVIGFSVMEEGLMVAPGNPHGIRSTAELAREGIRMVNREQGAALRILLDEHLAQCGIPHTAVEGYDKEVRTHNEGAQMVAYGAADAALGLCSVASAFGLGFVPMARVRCDLVIPGDMLEHPAIQVILDVLQSKSLHQEIASLPGYDPSQTGKIIAEIRSP